MAVQAGLQEGETPVPGGVRTAAALSLPPFQVDGYGSHAWFARGAARAVSLRQISSLPALRQAETALAGQARAIPRRATRIPTADIVTVRSAPVTLALAGPVRPLALPPPSARIAAAAGANDNGAQGSRIGRLTRRVLRELLTLTLLAAALAGVYQIGRLNAVQRVISVPDTDRQGARIT